MKTERLYLRVELEVKEYLQDSANRYFDGAISSVFEYMVERLDMYLEGLVNKNV